MTTLTTKEAAAQLSITQRSAWAAIRRGKLKATKRGRDWAIEASDVERYRVERVTRKGGRPKKTKNTIVTTRDNARTAHDADV